MAIQTSLNSQGSTPSGTSYGGLFTPPSTNYSVLQSPAAKALAAPASQVPMASSVANPGQSIPGSITGGSTAPQPPSQPIASQTHTNVDGSSVTTKYQPTTSGLLSGNSSSNSNVNPNQTAYAGGLAPNDPSNKYNTATGQLNPGYVAPQTTGGTSSATTTPSTTTSGTTSPTSTPSVTAGANTTTVSPNGLSSNPYTSPAQAGLLATLGAGQATYGQGIANANQYSTEANTALQQLQNIQGGLATGIGDINQQAIPLQFQQGRSQALQSMYGGQEQALSTELSGLGSLYSTAAGQQGSGIAGLLGGTNAAITGQSNLLPSQNFPFVYNPATGTFTAPGVNGQPGSTTGAPTLTFNPSTDASTLAQDVMNKQISFSDAENALSYGGKNTAAATQLTSAVLAAGGNPTNLQAQATGAAKGLGAVAAASGQAQAGNIQTAGTAATNAAESAYVAAYPQVKALNQAVNNITSLGNMTVQNAAGNNINPFAAAPANTTLAQIRTGLSNAGQVTFNSNMTQLAQAIQALYAGSGGNTPTGVQSAIGKMADGSLDVQGLQALLSAAQSEGALLLGNAKSTASAEFQDIQSGAGGTSGANITPSSNSGWASLGD